MCATTLAVFICVTVLVPMTCGSSWESQQQSCGRNTRNCTHLVDPWFVAIYQDEVWMICFGTLISPHIVLAVPYCFTEKDGSGRLLSPHRFVVTVGKSVNGWKLDRPRGETVQVRHISVPSQYLGKIANNAFGIALVDLITSVSNIPACVDWGHEFDITPGQRGTVPAWDASANFHNKQVVYVDYVSCVSEKRSDSKLVNLVTPDKFCFKLIEKTLIDLGMVGSGCLFEINGVYYIKGVQSDWIEWTLYTESAALNLGDRDVLHWMNQTSRSFDAYHNERR